MYRHSAIVFVCIALVVAAAASPIKFLSYYTFDFFKYGANITNLGSANLAPPLNDDPIAAAIFYDMYGLPSMITPGTRPSVTNSCFAVTRRRQVVPSASTGTPPAEAPGSTADAPRIRLIPRCFIRYKPLPSHGSSPFKTFWAGLLCRWLAGGVPGSSVAACALRGQRHCCGHFLR